MTDAAPSDLPILIAGGGIGGLAAALALARKGFSVSVFEKRAEATEEGAGIQIGPNGSRILIELGVADHLRHLMAVPQAIRIMDGVTGRMLTRLPLGRDIAERHGAPYWVLHRADLHGALRATVAGKTRIRLVPGAEVEDARSHAHGVTLRFTDGTEAQGAALIGADGLWSAIRTNVFKAPALSFTGKCALRAIVPSERLPAPLTAIDTTIWLRPAAHVVHYPVRGGQEVALVAIFDDKSLGETWAGAVDLASIAHRTSTFPDPLRTLLAVPTVWRQWSLYKLSGETPWVQDRIALLGDAAHPPLPFLAQGGVMALEDVAVLSNVLVGASGCEIPARLAEYERRRRPRTTRVIEASGRNGQIYHLDGLMRTARNTVLQMAPPARLMASYDWLYGWRMEDAAL